FYSHVTDPIHHCIPNKYTVIHLLKFLLFSAKFLSNSLFSSRLCGYFLGRAMHLSPVDQVVARASRPCGSGFNSQLGAWPRRPCHRNSPRISRITRKKIRGIV